MRILFVTVFTLAGCLAAHAQGPTARTELLSYGEMMALTPHQRIAYLHDLAMLLMIMEQKTEAKFDLVASEVLRRHRLEVALWLNLFGVTEATAEGVRREDILPTGDAPQALDRLSAPPAATAPPPAPESLGGMNGLKGLGEQLRQFGGKRMEVMGKALSDPAAAKAQADRIKADRAAGRETSTGVTPPSGPWTDSNMPSSTRSISPGSGANGRAGATVAKPPSMLGYPGVAGPYPLDPNAKPADDVIDNCPIHPPKCQTLSDEERKNLVLEFRKGEQYNKCIAGGYFTEKVANRRAGSCKLKNKEEVGKGAISCDNGQEALCNPMLFCLRYENLPLKSAKGPVSQVPIGLCVPRGPHVTRECYNRYNATLGLGTVKKRWDLVGLKRDLKRNPKNKSNINRLLKANVEPVACDFNTTETPGLKEKYEELRKSTQDGYRELCETRPEQKAKFADLFCEECGIISKQLHATLVRAGQDCTKTATPIAPNGGSGPGSNGGTGSSF